MSSKRLRLLFIFTAVFVISLGARPIISFASSLSEKFQTIETVNKKDHSPRSRAKVSIQEDPRNHQRYVLKIEGDGEYAGYPHVHWVSEADIEENSEGARILKTFTQIFHKEQIIFSSLKQFDYTTNLVTIKIQKENKAIPSIYTFPIRGAICDDVTMVYFFNRIVPAQNQAMASKFYLLTNEPKLYHVMIKPRGQEMIQLPSGKYPTEKFQLMADLGPLTEIVSKVVPATYVWFPQDDRENWIQYEGMETGYETAHILAYRVSGH